MQTFRALSAAAVLVFGLGGAARAVTGGNTAGAPGAQDAPNAALADGYASEAAFAGTAIGVSATSTGTYSTAVGFDAVAAGTDGVAIGSISSASANRSTAVGTLSQAQGFGSVAFGWTASATGSQSIAIGNVATAAGSGDVAVGSNADASGGQSVAIGQDSSATGYNSVALGTGSLADQDDTVSVGTSSARRRVVNVADGVDAHDAATVGQLNARFSDVDGKIESVRSEALTDSQKAGAVVAAAASAAVAASAVPGHNKIAVGAGSLGGQAGVGLAYQHSWGPVGATFMGATNGDANYTHFGGGVAFGW